MSFQDSLDVGKAGETEISKWLMERGFNILPIYEVLQGNYKGPTLYASSGETIIAPDLLAFKGDKIIWFEAKHKTAFSWHRKTSRFVTGIDIHHYEQYQKISKLVDWPVWLLFLHKGGQAKDSPASPSGLYGNDLIKLMDTVNHTHGNYGKSGMVYWAEQSLRKICNYPLTGKVNEH